MDNKVLDKIISIIRNKLNEESALVVPTNNVSSGNIAGTPDADPGNPPVGLSARKRKSYIYVKGGRKLWQKK
jgi:hypothetical protein